MRRRVGTMFTVLMASCLAGRVAAAGGADAERLAAWLSGSFSSAAQAEADPHFRDIRLHVVPVWTARADGPWLYVEQAAASSLDKPYRQRVYRIVKTGKHRVESRVFELARPGDWVGTWKELTPLAALTPEDLLPRAGCEVKLEYLKKEKAFKGSTEGKGCKSELRGASYATSEARIMPDRLFSWDRGFDAAGKQVWGAEKGPYEFVKEP